MTERLAKALHFYYSYIVQYNLRSICVEGGNMKSILEIRELLKRYGTFIYSGDRVADLELMEAEVKELYEAKLIEPKEYQFAILLLRQEMEREQKTREK